MSVLESKQTILQPEVAAIHYTLLLVDMWGSVIDSGDMPALVEAASSFSDRVGPYQKVAIYAFDGSPHVTPIVGFGGNVRGGIARAGHPPPSDPSTNLNGAVIEGGEGPLAPDGAARRAAALRHAGGLHRRHRSRAPGQPRRRHARARLGGLRDLRHRRRAEVDKRQLSRIGRSGTFASLDRADIAGGFDDVAARIEASSRRFTCCRTARPRGPASTTSRSRR